MFTIRSARLGSAEGLRFRNEPILQLRQMFAVSSHVASCWSPKQTLKASLPAYTNNRVAAPGADRDHCAIRARPLLYDCGALGPAMMVSDPMTVAEISPAAVVADLPPMAV